MLNILSNTTADYVTETFKQYKCSPLPSINIPVLTQLALFVGFKAVLSRLSIEPTESRSTMSTLLVLANPDSSALGISDHGERNWVFERGRKRASSKSGSKGKRRVIEGGYILARIPKLFCEGLPSSTSFLHTWCKISSSCFVLIKIYLSLGVTLYLVPSAAFGLGQTWTMEWMDSRRQRRLHAKKVDPSPRKTDLRDYYTIL